MGNCHVRFLEGNRGESPVTYPMHTNRNYLSQTLIIKMIKNIKNSSFNERKGGKKNGNKNYITRLLNFNNIN